METRSLSRLLGGGKNEIGYVEIRQVGNIRFGLNRLSGFQFMALITSILHHADQLPSRPPGSATSFWTVFTNDCFHGLGFEKFTKRLKNLAFIAFNINFQAIHNRQIDVTENRI